MVRFAVYTGQLIAVAWCTLVAQAWVMQIRLVIVPHGVPDREWSIFPGLLILIVWPQRAILGAWMYGKVPMTLVCIYGIVATLWAIKGWPRLVVAIFLVATVLSMAPFIRWAQPDPGPAAFEWTMRLLSLGITTLIAIKIHILFRDRVLPWAVGLAERSDRRPTKGGRKRYNLGFTLIEVLAVIAILLVLAAITFPLLASSKDSALTTREIAQTRQVYVALNLYEADSENKSPSSLVTLIPTYMASAMLKCPTDARNKLTLPTWPSNPWVNIVPPDLQEYVGARSPFVNSYFYLKPFEGRFASGRSYEEYRNDPRIGLISGVGLMKCGMPSGTGPGGCMYWDRGGPGQPAANLSGRMITVRTDGSAVSRLRPENCSPAELGQFQLFFFASLSCGQTSVTPG